MGHTCNSPQTQPVGEHVSGEIRAIEAETRRALYLRQHQIAGVLEIQAAGPTRILFVGGGHIDVCGSAELWRREIRLAQLTEIRDGNGRK